MKGIATGRMTRGRELGQSRPSSGIEYPILAHSFGLERKPSDFIVGAIPNLMKARALRCRQQRDQVFPCPTNSCRYPSCAIDRVVRFGASAGKWSISARAHGKLDRNSPLVAVGYRRFVVSVDCLPMGDRGRVTFQAVASAPSLRQVRLTSVVRPSFAYGRSSVDGSHVAREI